MSDSVESSAPSSFQRLIPGSDRFSKTVRGLFPGIRARLRGLHGEWQESELEQAGEKIERLDQTFVEDGARTVTDTDVETVVEEADAIENRFRENGPLRRLLEDGRILLELVQDIRAGRYRNVPMWTLSAAAFALLYVLNPFDAIPDALPVLGVLDDAAVVSACLALLEQDLHDYRSWRRSNEPPPTRSESPPSHAEPAGERRE